MGFGIDRTLFAKGTFLNFDGAKSMVNDSMKCTVPNPTARVADLHADVCITIGGTQSCDVQ